MTSSPPDLPPLPSSVRSLWRSLRLGYQAEPMLLVVAGVTTLAAAVPDALFALGLKVLTDAVTAHDRQWLLVAATLLATLATGSWLLTVLSDRLNLRLAERCAIHIEATVARLQSTVATIEHHERSDVLDRLSVLRDHADALSQLYRSLFQTTGAVVRLLLTVALLMTVDPLLGLLALVAIPTVVVSSRRAAREKEVEERGAQHRRLARHLFTLGSTAAPGKEIRVAGVAEWLRTKHEAAWLSSYLPMARARWATAVWQALAWVCYGAAFISGIVLVARRSPGAAGDVALVLAASGRLTAYINHTVSETHFLRTIWIDVSRRMAWLEDFAASRRGAADRSAPDRITEGISLRNVSFRYPGAKRSALEDVNLVIPAGAVVAIVGENGAGKSTLVKLLCRFYDPTGGRIAVDGQPLDRIPPERWRQRLSGAFQDFVRFEYPAWLTVGLGDHERGEDRDAVAAALARAGAQDVVDALPHGLDTQLGSTWEGGVELSVGQWQKLALARGFMRTTPLLLVLDEPTAAIDAESEHALFERYAAAARGGAGRITVLVSHRFSTVRMADLIVVLDGARVAEQGSHEQLMARGGKYAELYRIQAAAYR